MLQLAEIFYSIQGEGMWTGTPAVFVRLAGCNLACDFCDTDYSTKFFASVDEVVEKVRETGGDCRSPRRRRSLRHCGATASACISNRTERSIPTFRMMFGFASRQRSAWILVWRRAQMKRS